MSPQSLIAHYRIVSKIGEGGMGAVYRATDTKLNRDVAIKVLPDTFAEDPDRLARFTREAQVLASVNHPNIAAIYGVEERALILELVEGEDLRGPLPIETALAYARQIGDALEAAHEKGIVHRDLKPANIKVTPQGLVKVLDFGLAAIAQGGASSATDPALSPTLTIRATQAGVIMGTAGYMSPEQARGQVVDKRTDIWAFGVVLYELLSGKTLFQGETVSDTLAGVLRSDLDLAALPADTPPAVRRLLRRCLERDRKRRLPDIGMVRLELDEPAEPPAELMVPAAVAPAPSRRPWLVAGFAAAMALAFAGLYFFRKPPETATTAFLIPPPENAHFHNGRISPDGRRMVFEIDSQTDNVARTYLATRSMDFPEFQRLPGTEGAAHPFWSPDSRSIAYSQNRKLWRLEPGGAPLAICDLPGGAGGALLGGGDGDWSGDGVIIHAADGGPVRVPASGGAVKPLPIKPGETRETLRFLPDGKRYLYEDLARVEGREPTAVRIGSIDSPESTLLAEGAEDGALALEPSDPRHSHILFLRDGTLATQPFDAVAARVIGEPSALTRRKGAPGGISTSTSQTGTLSYLEYEGGEPRIGWRTIESVTDVAPNADYRDVVLSPDATKAVVTIQAGKGADLWIFRLDRQEQSRFTLEPGTTGHPVWSPDGRWIAWAATRGASNLIYRKAADGSGGAEVLVESSQRAFPCDWSRDGRFLLYSAEDPATKTDLWLLPLTGDRKPQPYLRTPQHEMQGQISPDGHFLAYESDESGRYEVYVSTFPDPAGGRWQISRDGARTARWRPDGKQLFFISATRRMRLVDVKTQPSFSTGAPQPLFGLPTYSREARFDYAIAPDGRILGISDGRHQGPFVVVQNWLAKGRQ